MRVGISGAGFIARGIFALLSQIPDFTVTGILTRRPIRHSSPFLPEDLLTNEIDALIDGADIVLECSGDTVHAAEVLVRAGEAGRLLVTMNSEAQVTVGSALVQRGYEVTETHGDQPGCLAELDRAAREFGFVPLAYVNLKGFLNLTPTREDMLYWSERQGLSLRQVTSFTDGSKLQIEQALVANGLNACIAKPGMIGGTVEDLADLDYLAEAALEHGQPLSDYVLNPGGPPGILVLASNPVADQAEGYMPFDRLKTRNQTAYRLLRPHHLVHLEVAKTLRQVAAGDPPLLTNGLRPTVSVAAVAKRALPAGHVIETALGGFDLRGEAVEIAGNERIVPITLLDGARLRHSVEPGETIVAGSVEVEDTLAYALYRSAIGQGRSRVQHAGSGRRFSDGLAPLLGLAQAVMI